MNSVKVQGRLLSWLSLLVALAASVAANVAFARPEWGPRLSSGVAPLLVVLAAGLLERVPLAGIVWWRRAAAYGGLGVVVIAAFVTSFEHQFRLLVAYGNPALSAILLPVAVDGLIILASVCLTVIAERRRELSQVEAVTSQGPATASSSTVSGGFFPAPGTTTAVTAVDEPGIPNIPAKIDGEPVVAVTATTDPEGYRLVGTPALSPEQPSPATVAETATDVSDIRSDTPPAAPRRKRPRRQATNAEKITRLRDRKPDLSVSDIAKRVGVTERTVHRHLRASIPVTDVEPDTALDTVAEVLRDAPDNLATPDESELVRTP